MDDWGIVGITTDQMIVLDSLRKQRNVADYSGDLITESTMKECLRQVDQLFTLVSEWLETLFPELR